MPRKINYRGKEIVYENQPAFFQTIQAGEWEPETFDILDAFVTPGKIFIDIGAWVGALSIYAARLGGRVFAIEPDPISYKELVQNIVANNVQQQIDALDIAISDHTGAGVLNSMTNGFGNSESSLLDRGVIDGEKRVRTYTLADLFNTWKINPTEVCLVKMDVEGSEVFILNGAKDFLKEHKIRIYISFHPAYYKPFVETFTMFTNIVFPIYTVMDNNMRVHNERTFWEALQSKDNHTFLLFPK